MPIRTIRSNAKSPLGVTAGLIVGLATIIVVVEASGIPGVQPLFFAGLTAAVLGPVWVLTLPTWRRFGWGLLIAGVIICLLVLGGVFYILFTAGS